MKALIYQGEKRLTLEDIPAPEGPFVVRCWAAPFAERT